MLAGGRELGLDLLVEAHDAEELRRAVELDAEIIGVNARDLGTFAIDRTAQLALVASAPRERVIVAESAIGNRAQGAEAELAGASAILVGSALMRADDPGGQARRDPRAAAREGLRAHPRGGRRRRGRGRRGPGGLRPRREPAPRARLRSPCPRRCSRWPSASASRLTPAPISSSSIRRRTATARATASSCARARRSPPCATSPGSRATSGTGRRRPRSPAGCSSPAASGPRTCARRSTLSGPGASTPAAASSSPPGVKDHNQVRAFVEAVRSTKGVAA